MSMVSLVSKSQKEASKSTGAKQTMTPGEDTQTPPRLYLEHHHLAKLGIKKMPPVGTKLHIEAEAHVGSTSEDQDRGDGGGPRRSMTLHLHKMDIGSDDQAGETDVSNEEESKKEAKAEMDKALSRQQGSESSKAKPAGGKKGQKGG
jgi:hypothetical protein